MIQIAIIITFATYLLDMWFSDYIPTTKIYLVDKLLNCVYCITFWTTLITLTILTGLTIHTIICSIAAYWLQVAFQKYTPFF